MAKRLSRRDVTRAVPVLMLGGAIGGIGRFLAACTNESPKDLRTPTNQGPRPVPPTDEDEFVPGEGTPIDANDVPPTIPNASWEARARQLESDQKRIWGNVFTNDPAGNGVMAGKERSHVPSATVATEGKYKKATVIVQHVMGTNLLDAGAYDAAPDVREAGPDAIADAAADGDAARPDAAPDAAPIDAGKPPEHYITTIYLRATVNGVDAVVGLWEFASTDAAPPTVKFTLPEGVTSVVAYEWCTLHGLWKSDPIPVM